MNKNFDFKESKNDFVKSKLVDGYDTILTIFTEFLERKKISYETIKTVFQGIRTEFIIESLNYYIESRKVTSLGASGKYASCIKEYFIFIVQNEYIKNDELMAEFTFKTYNENSYRFKVNHFLSDKPEIVESEGFEIFNQINDLINDCDDTMNDEYIISRLLANQVYFNKYRSALMIKLILLTGIAYRTIIKINIEDLDLKHCQITINGLTIHLPNNLIDQFIRYADTRANILHKKENNTDTLFIEFNGNPISVQTTTIGSFLKDLTGRGDLNGIIKYAITNMIKKGINHSLIVKFTNVGPVIYNWCQNEVNKSMDLYSSKYFDAKIRSLDIFDSL